MSRRRVARISGAASWHGALAKQWRQSGGGGAGNSAGYSSVSVIRLVAVTYL